MRNGRSPLILFINGADGATAWRATQFGGKPCCTLTVVHGMDEAEAALARGLRPDVIFLRLWVREEPGLEITKIARLRSQPAIEHVPIVVFADSKDPRLVAQVYEHPMTCYVQRPRLEEEYLSVLRNTLDFWCNTAVLPARTHDWSAGMEKAGTNPGPSA
jgi:DNA-binding NarL/FixJ family response regulator